MLRIQTPYDALSRRDWLRVGGIGLGALSLPQLQQARASEANGSFGKAKSVIMICLLGGPPQHETWDPKPLAPAEVRGQFGTIATRTPGFRVGELMPMTANLTDRLAVLRAVVTNDNAHSSSGYQMLTGHQHVPMNRENATPKPPNNMPTCGAMVRYHRPAAGKLPSAITIPEHIWNDGNITWPGQDAGVLGRRYDPWLIPCDPSDPAFRIDGVDSPGDLPPLRLNDRRGLLEQLNAHLDRHKSSPVHASHEVGVSKAFELVGSGAARQAFDISRESASVRDRYGRSRFGQSALLARRLVESGVSLVQVNWTRIANKLNQGGWDTHAKHNEAMKDTLMPIMDRAYSALIQDLEVRGLLDETLVVWFGEFGRTPRFNSNGGRDHWGHVFSLALAGGGVRGGVMHGSSDKNGAYPLSGNVEPRDLIATVFHCLGIAPDSELRDTEGRPFPICRGEVIRPIL